MKEKLQGIRGFSLVELLVVIAILALLAIFAVPAVNERKQGMDLGVAASQWIDQLALARQTARTKNRKIEVRIYFESSREGLQLWMMSEDGETSAPLQNLLKLPESVALSGNPLWSSLLTESVSGAALSDTHGKYHVFHYFPSGVTDLSGTDAPTLTLILRKDTAKTVLPANFMALRIDLQTGMVRAFQPS